MKHIAFMTMMLTFGVATVYAQESVEARRTTVTMDDK